MKLIGSLLPSNRTFRIVNPCSNGFRITGPPRQEAEILSLFITGALTVPPNNYPVRSSFERLDLPGWAVRISNAS